MSTKKGRPRGRTIDPSTFDEEIVQRVISGKALTDPIRTVDQWEIIRRLAGPKYGYSDGQIAHVLNLAGLKRPRVSVMRTRNFLGIAPALTRNEHNKATMTISTDIVPARPKALK